MVRAISLISALQLAVLVRCLLPGDGPAAVPPVAVPGPRLRLVSAAAWRLRVVTSPGTRVEAAEARLDGPSWRLERVHAAWVLASGGEVQLDAPVAEKAEEVVFLQPRLLLPGATQPTPARRAVWSGRRLLVDPERGPLFELSLR